LASDPTSGALTQLPTDMLTGATPGPAWSLPLVLIGVTTLIAGLLIDLRRRSRGIRNRN
jgi:hypothetical protein